MLGVLVIGSGLTACGSVATAKRTSSPAYLATSPTIVALLQFTHHGEFATGTIRFIESHDAKTALLQQLSGSYRGGHINLRTSDTKPSRSLALLGTLASYGVHGTLRLGNTTTALHLRFTRSTVGAYNRAKNSFRVRVLATAQTHVTREQILSDIATLNSELSVLSRDGSALGTDVQSLEENLGTEVADVASAKSDIQKSETLANSTPVPAHVALCSSVDLVRTDATNVANDDQFVEGFIAGLVSTRKDVTKEATTVRVNDVALRTEMGITSGTLTVNVPSESTVAGILNFAANDISLATTTANATNAHLSSDVQLVYHSLNSLITSTECGSTVADPKSLTVP